MTYIHHLKGPRSESPSSKQVRFSVAETIYEPFDAKDAHTIDQILALLHVASRKVPVESSIPLSSSHSVAYRHNEAARENAVLVVPSRDSATYIQPQRVEYVNNPPRSRSQSQRSHSQSQSHTSSHPCANDQVRSPRVRDDSVRLVSNMRKPSSRSSHHRSDSDASSRSYGESRSGERKRANRTSSGSDKTLVNDSELPWAPATSVIYAKECGRNKSNSDENQPIIKSPKVNSFIISIYNYQCQLTNFFIGLTASFGRSIPNVYTPSATQSQSYINCHNMIILTPYLVIEEPNAHVRLVTGDPLLIFTISFL